MFSIIDEMRVALVPMLDVPALLEALGFSIAVVGGRVPVAKLGLDMKVWDCASLYAIFARSLS
jgi:hypothetical protein